MRLKREWRARSGFEAYTQHHFKTVSSNINMLACSAYWSTIKTLPATLPEPSSEDQGPRTTFLHPQTVDNVSRIAGLTTSDIEAHYKYIGRRIEQLEPQALGLLTLFAAGDSIFLRGWGLDWVGCCVSE